MYNFSQNENSRTAKGEPDCVRCGYCCNKVICINGEDDGYGKCKFLKVSDPDLGTFSCGKKDEIMAREKNSTTPMFDHYCSSAFMNDIRNEVIRKIEKANKIII